MIQNNDLLQTITARSPAKLIISGEHSVLYNKTALAIAVNLYTTATTTWHTESQIYFKLKDLKYVKSCTLQALRKLTRTLHRDYNSFLQGKLNIRSVLKKPFELLQYSVATMLDRLNVTLPHGISLTVDSNIPIGCGMGSSAAAVMSTIYSLKNLLNLNVPSRELLNVSKNIENLQHGHSSGLDLHPVMYGGGIFLNDNTIEKRVVPTTNMQIINTGVADSTTGECVAFVANKFKDKTLNAEFSATTAKIANALASGAEQELLEGIAENQLLLQQIGVVPEKVSDFISDINKSGMVGKVCGAGAIRGDNAGILLVAGNKDISPIVDQYGYNMQQIEIDNYGTRIL